MHLGTEPESKAYRLFDSENRKIVISWDVIFDESKGCKWRDQGEENNKEPGTFGLSFGEFGNKGIIRDDDIMEVVNVEQHTRALGENNDNRET